MCRVGVHRRLDGVREAKHDDRKTLAWAQEGVQAKQSEASHNP
jgi:hypothetical protein